MKKFTKSQALFKKASDLIPLASQTFSKSHLQYVEGASPLFIERGSGAKVWDVDGNAYIDMISGLLPVILGYRYGAVDKAIRAQLKKGITFSLPSPLEYELAALLKKHIPCAEMARFGKNGSDATTGAIRLARAVTGKDRVAVCGYHGWHDWYIGSTARDLGVPAATKALTHVFMYNDIGSLQALLEKHPGEFAAVILEPENYVEQQEGFLKAVQELAHKHKALLIFDEVITGFRWSLGGAQKHHGVTPDLATFGKSMANGMPISALVGKKEYMKRIEDIFYSFTQGGETLSIAAAIATIAELEKKNVIPYIWDIGERLRKGAKEMVSKHALGDVMELKGKPCWQVWSYKDGRGYSGLEIKSFIQQELIEAGFLWYGQHNMSFSHTKKDIDRLIAAYDAAFGKLREALDTKTLKEKLRGRPIQPVFKVR